VSPAARPGAGSRVLDVRPALGRGPLNGLTASQILFLHAQVAAQLGQPRGVAAVPALAAALRAAGDTTPGAGLFDRAAVLAVALARHKPFHSANLALAASAAGLLLRQYDLDLQLDPADAPALRALFRADDPASLADWLRAHTVPLP
jgi:prophage maintenance system killer protein